MTPARPPGPAEPGPEPGPEPVAEPVDGLPGDGQLVALTGYLVDVVRRVNRAGATWAEAALAINPGQVNGHQVDGHQVDGHQVDGDQVDGDQVVPVEVFPQTYARFAALVREDMAVRVTGRVDRRERTAPVVIVSELNRGGA